MENTSDIHYPTWDVTFHRHLFCPSPSMCPMPAAQDGRSVLRVRLWHIQGELWPRRGWSLRTHSRYCSSSFRDEQTEPGSPFKVAGLLTYWDQTECSSFAHCICLLLYHRSMLLVKCYILKEKNRVLFKETGWNIEHFSSIYSECHWYVTTGNKVTLDETSVSFQWVFGDMAYFTFLRLKKPRSASVISVNGAFPRRNVWNQMLSRLNKANFSTWTLKSAGLFWKIFSHRLPSLRLIILQSDVSIALLSANSA